VQPDQLDIEEWDLNRQSASMMQELPQVAAAPDPSLPLTIVRTARPVVAKEVSQQLQTSLQPSPTDQDDRRATLERRRAKRRQERQRRLQSSRPDNRSSESAFCQDDPRLTSALHVLAQRDQQALGGRSRAPGETASANQPVPGVVPPSRNGGNEDTLCQETARADTNSEVRKAPNQAPSNGQGRGSSLLQRWLLWRGRR
jgi:hypothetical protein